VPATGSAATAYAESRQNSCGLAGCALVQAPHGRTVVAIVPPVGGEPYIAHAGRVIAAAHRAGLGYVEHIVTVTAPIAGERFTNLTAPADRVTLRTARPSLEHGRPHLDLLAFVLRGGPHG
jgi:hypothetical protein